MSENTKIKLNLKALEKQDSTTMNKQEDSSISQIETQEDTTIKKTGIVAEKSEKTGKAKTIETEKNHEETTPSFKISLGDIKKAKQETSKKEEAKTQETQEPLHNSQSSDGIINGQNKNTEKKNTKEENTSKNTNKKDINFACKEKLSSDTDQEKKVTQSSASNTQKSEAGKKSGKLFGIFRKRKKREENKNIEPTEVEKDAINEEVHFNNYTSVFETQSQNLLKRIQHFKYTPKTRIGLVLSLIICTVMIISGLMVFFPEKHNFDVYQASILNILSKPSETQNENLAQIPAQESTPSKNKENNNQITEENNTDIEEANSNEENVDLNIISEEKIIQKEKEKDQIKNYILNKYNSKE